MAKVFRTLRNHWKKSTFAAILGYYGIEYVRDWHRNYLVMRDFSAEALVHGQRALPPGAKNKHITLFLNPTAGNRKSKTKLEKYSEPLLHLSGFLVNVVKTERIDEARDLAGVIEKTNVIAVAGGDGTLFETVTGLLRREDAKDALRRYPIAVIPLGSHNQFANRLFNRKTEGVDPKFIAEGTMAVVRHKIKPQDVMQITIVDELQKNEEAEENVKKPSKPFYSLAEISVGQFREAQKLKEEMPSLFPNYFSTFWSLLKTPDQHFRAEINYVPTCVGCLNCLKQDEQESTSEVLSSSSSVNSPSILSRIFSLFRPQSVNAEGPNESNSNEDPTLVNPNCGNWSSFCIDTSEFNIKPCGNGRMQIEINKKYDKTDFMIEGLKRYRNEGNNSYKLVDCREIEIVPVGGQELFSIDNEEFDMKRIKIKCLKDKVHFFVPA